MRGWCRSPFRVLFSKDLKGRLGPADKGCVSTLAHTMMTTARSADSGLAGPGELDRYPYAEAPAGERAAARSWVVPMPSSAGWADGDRPAAAADCTANLFSSWGR